MKVKPRVPKRSSMLVIDPVTRLSRHTTWSPRSSSARQRCDPRKPAPPVTTTRAMSEPTDAGDREAPTTERLPVEQVAGVDDGRLAQRRGHLVEVEPAELVPLG